MRLNFFIFLFFYSFIFPAEMSFAKTTDEKIKQIAKGCSNVQTERDYVLDSESTKLSRMQKNSYKRKIICNINQTEAGASCTECQNRTNKVEILADINSKLSQQELAALKNIKINLTKSFSVNLNDNLKRSAIFKINKLPSFACNGGGNIQFNNAITKEGVNVKYRNTKDLKNCRKYKITTIANLSKSYKKAYKKKYKAPFPTAAELKNRSNTDLQGITNAILGIAKKQNKIANKIANKSKKKIRENVALKYIGKANLQIEGYNAEYRLVSRGII